MAAIDEKTAILSVGNDWNAWGEKYTFSLDSGTMVRETHKETKRCEFMGWRPPII